MQLETMLTVDEYARLPRQTGERLELTRGLLVRQPRAGTHHGDAAARIYEALRRHAEHTGAEVLFDSVFVLDDEPPTVRSPDVALFDPSRKTGPHRNGFRHGAPDVAVEITATPDTARREELLEKVFEYLDAGAAQVWVVDLATRAITQYERGSAPTTYRAGDVIRGTGLLQGFATPAEAFLV